MSEHGTRAQPEPKEAGEPKRKLTIRVEPIYDETSVEIEEIVDAGVTRLAAYAIRVAKRLHDECWAKNANGLVGDALIALGVTMNTRQLVDDGVVNPEDAAAEIAGVINGATGGYLNFRVSQS